MDAFIVCENLVKIYKVAGLEVVALQGLDLNVQEGELLGIVGTSGSGKSTLLNVLGGLDWPSAGRVAVNGRDLLKLSDADLDAYRRREVGFVWQQTARNLIPYLSAWDNVQLPMAINGMGGKEKKAWTAELLHAIGLWEFRKHRLAQLSGGQQQRIAIAVALANRPRLLLGDEPTGELDSATAQEILALLGKMNQEYGLTTLIVTHDPQVARAVDRVVTIRDGRTSSETIKRVADVEAALTQGLERLEQSAVELTQVEANHNNTSHTSHVFEEYVVVDAAGRLQLPLNLREQVGIGSRVTLEVIDDGVLIRPISPDTGNGVAWGLGDGEAVSADQPPPLRIGRLRQWLQRGKTTTDRE